MISETADRYRILVLVLWKEIVTIRCGTNRHSFLHFVHTFIDESEAQTDINSPDHTTATTTCPLRR